MSDTPERLWIHADNYQQPHRIRLSNPAGLAYYTPYILDTGQAERIAELIITIRRICPHDNLDETTAYTTDPPQYRCLDCGQLTIK